MHAERQATDGLDSGHTTSNLELAYRFAFGFGLSLVVDAVMNGALGRATRTLSHCARRLLGIACVIVSIGIAQTLVDISIGRSHGSDLSFGSVLLVWNVVYRVAVTRVVPGNFSLGESGLVFSLVALLTDDMLRWTVRVYRDANDSALVTTQHAVDRWMVYHLTQALLLGMLLIGLVTMPVLQLHRKRVLTGLVPKRTWFGIASGLTHWTSWTFYGGLAAVVLLVIRPWMLLVMHHVAADSVPDPFLWTWWFVVKSPERMAVVGWWVLCLCAMVLALRGTVSGTITTVPTSDLLSSDASPSTRSTQRKVRSRVTTPIGSSVAPTMRRPPAVELDRRRKFFHWMAVAMFLPGIAIVVGSCCVELPHMLPPFPSSHTATSHKSRIRTYRFTLYSVRICTRLSRGSTLHGRGGAGRICRCLHGEAERRCGAFHFLGCLPYQSLLGLGTGGAQPYLLATCMRRATVDGAAYVWFW